MIRWVKKVGVCSDRTERQRQLHASVAQKGSSKSSQRVRGRPARRQHLSNSIFFPLSPLTLATSVAFQHHCVFFLGNRLLDKRVFDSLSDRSLAETPAYDPPAPAQPRCRRRSGPPALFRFIFAAVCLSEALFLSRFSLIHRPSHKQIDRRVCVRARVCAEKRGFVFARLCLM